MHHFNPQERGNSTIYVHVRFSQPHSKILEMTSLENTHHVIPQVEVSRVSSKGVQATDITIDFLRATSGL